MGSNRELTGGSETNRSPHSETTGSTRKLWPSTRKLPLPSDSETNGHDSETTQQRLGNLKHARRDSETTTPNI